MCLNPISIVNPTKYVSLRYRDPYLLQVPCGKCAECQSTLSNQWLYRSFVEFNDCLSSGGFVLFDTLTYAPKSLPHFSDYFPDLEQDFPCFKHKHITDFFKRLRIGLDRAGFKDVSLRYFLSSEYGTDDSKSHRPHYHLLLYVYGDISPATLSQRISEAWIYGRTDGMPWKTLNYLYNHNVIKENTSGNILRTANYVTKYVQKSCVFQKELDRRIAVTMANFAKKFAPNREDEWQKSLAAHRIRLTLSKCVNQFHRQSLHFGESALSELDLNQLFQDGCLFMPHFKAVKIPVVLPTYYKRKLFYRLVEIDGSKSWQLNDLGIEYMNHRQQKLLDDLQSRLQCVCIQHHLIYDCKALADYVLNYRGRIKGDFPPSIIEDRLQHIDLYNYVTIHDKDALLARGLTPQFLGNTSIGFNVEVMPPAISIKDFIARYVFLDSDKEKELSHIYYLLSFIDKGKQDAYELKQKLTNVYKLFI